MHLKCKYAKRKYPQYFFPEIKSFIKNRKEDQAFYPKVYLNNNDLFLQPGHQNHEIHEKDEDNNNWISEFSNKLPDNFYENRKIGENESKICELIRKDLIDNFITYVEHENYILNSTIPHSNYESTTTLIEYAVFFGSNQIFKYLFKNGVTLTSSLWGYAIHSNNPETIHLLEENDIKAESYSQIFNEAIKCHHIEVANYIMNNYLDKESKDEEKEVKNDENDSLSSSLKSYNFAFLQEESINQKILFQFV